MKNSLLILLVLFGLSTTLITSANDPDNVENVKINKEMIKKFNNIEYNENAQSFSSLDDYSFEEIRSIYVAYKNNEVMIDQASYLNGEQMVVNQNPKSADGETQTEIVTEIGNR